MKEKIKVEPTERASEFETILREENIRLLDRRMDELVDTNYILLGENISQEEADDVESIMMSYRNTFAGIDWDGQQREYEKYKVERWKDTRKLKN